MGRTLSDGAGHGLDDQVAGGMAVGVVDGLEVVDVQHQQQRRFAGARHAVDLAGQRHLELNGGWRGRSAHRGWTDRTARPARPAASCDAHRCGVRKQGAGLLQQLQGLVQTSAEASIRWVGAALFQRVGLSNKIVVSKQSSSGLCEPRS
jgi:hypothetical protein